MRIGIVSNSDLFIPLAYTLVTQKLQVYIFFSMGQDSFVAQKAKGFAGQYNVPFSEESDIETDLYRWINGGNFDACFIIGYTRLIKLSKMSGSSAAILNIHFGPLPAFKGPVPVFWQLKYGVDKIGLAIHQLTEKFDDGPVVWTKELPNQDFFNYEVVCQYLCNMCVEGALFILNLLAHKMPLLPVNIPSAMPGAYHKRPGADDVTINWDKMGAIEICNLVKACNPWNKGAISFFNGKELKLLDATFVKKEQQTPAAGVIVDDSDGLKIGTCDGEVIKVNMLFYNDSFIPAYHCKYWGIIKGAQFCAP